jgi:N-methylhydantoinase B
MSDPKGFSTEVDAVTMEVVRMRLENIVSEMSVSMMRSSGSPVITEAGDFNTALFDADGRLFAYSDYVQFHIGSAAIAVANLLKTIDPNEMREGDAFISNDPHTAGSTHPPDISVITPVFFEGKLVAFAQSQAHFLDIGGMTAGGFAPAAYDCFAEAIRLPPGVKILDGGKIVDSVRRILTNNVRLPVLLWNDVRSLIASNNVGVRRLVETISEVGVEEFSRVTEHAFNVAEAVVRQRLAKLPDGTYEAVEWQEHNGHVDELFEIRCQMIIQGDSVTFDFTGSCVQTDGFVNCSLGSTTGALASAAVPILAWDLPLNAGVLAPITIIAPSGSIVNAAPPAPVSNGHLEVGGRVSRVVTRLLNMAYERSPDSELRSRTQGCWSEAWTGGISAGIRDGGEFFVLFNMDGSAIGSGAQSQSDGLDCAGLMTQVGNILPDVEMNELLYPVLYLWKRLDPESSGAGQYRGGLGVDFAWTLHGCSGVSQAVFAPCARLPALGYGGGYPGGGTSQLVYRRADLESALAGGPLHPRGDGADAVVDELELTAQDIPISHGDVFRQRMSGGGGHGDPLLRDEQSAFDDLQGGFITIQAASDAYGLVLADDGLNIDWDATTARRAELRRARLSNAPSAEITDRAAGDGDGAKPLSHYAVLRNGQSCCRMCGGQIGTASAWRSSAKVTYSCASVHLGARGTRTRAQRDDQEVLLEEAFCPHCATALEVTMVARPATTPSPSLKAAE